MTVEPNFKFTSRTTDVMSCFIVGVDLCFVYHTWGTAFSGHRAFSFVAAVASFYVVSGGGGQKLLVVSVHDFFHIVGTAIAYFDSFSVQNFVKGVMFGEITVKDI